MFLLLWFLEYSSPRECQLGGQQRVSKRIPLVRVQNPNNNTNICEIRSMNPSNHVTEKWQISRTISTIPPISNRRYRKPSSTLIVVPNNMLSFRLQTLVVKRSAICQHDALWIANLSVAPVCFTTSIFITIHVFALFLWRFQHFNDVTHGC